MKKLPVIVCVLLLWSVNGFTQGTEGIVLKGIVVNSRDNTPVAFANIGVEGTLVGVASDVNGDFTLHIPEGLKGEKIFFSAIGYHIVKKSLNELNADPLIVKMDAQSYDLTGVDVSAESRVMFRILQTASEKISTNYVAVPCLYNAKYREEYFEGNVKKQYRYATLQLYDQKGYHRTNTHDAYRHRHYRFLTAERNFEPVFLTRGQVLLDDLLSFDIVRLTGNVLDREYLDDYDLSLDKEGVVEGKPAWIINYRLSNPDLARTGDYCANLYGGKIYIGKDDYAVLKNETWVKTSGHHIQGRSLAGEALDKVNTTYKFTAIYKQHNDDKYHLAYISYNRKWQTGDGKGYMEAASLLVDTIDTEPAEKFTGRVYFERAGLK